MYGETGQVCRTAGRYKCFGHPDFIIALQPGEVYPKCNYEGPHEALWIRVKETEKVKSVEKEGT